MDMPVESFHSRARLALSLLGPPEVLLNGEPASGLGSQKVLALLGYLAVGAHRWHLRSELAALLWPDQPAKRAYQNLRKTLSRLRYAIGDRTRSGDRTPSGDDEADPPHLISDSLTIQFNPQSDYWLDVGVFKTLVSNTEQHPHRRLDACPTCVSQLARACELYRGDLLAGLHVPDSLALEEWLLIEREQLLQQACSALHALAGARLAHGEFEAAQHNARQLLQLDPWNEAALRLLLRALVSSGERNAALQHFGEFREALVGELQVEPEDETLALVEQIRAGTLDDMHPRTPAGSVPTPTTAFVGREAERRQITEYLASQDQRLITLYGPGGSGKTRLALEIATEQAPLWLDGVWFIPLAEAPDPQHLVNELAAALDLQVADRSPELSDLLSFLQPKELLLILDSFEHLVDGGSLLDDILRWSPAVRILITSRTRLGLRGEWTVQLDGLEVPPDVPATAAEAKDYSAVKLFLQNARRVSSDFTLSLENLPPVVRICRLVEGLPLGVELAAAWARLFPCRQIADEIERSPDFLHNPGSHNPGRQHSLRATFEYSYNLLPDAEQVLFRKLSVFRGGFTPGTAQQVAGAGPSNLASLLDKSLIQGTPSKRLDLHPILREYAAEKLAAVIEEERETRERHCQLFLSFVQQREGTLRGENPKKALVEIDTELANVRAAWQWAVTQARLRDLDASISGLSRFYSLRGLFQEGETAFGGAVEDLVELAQENPAMRRVACRVLLEQGRFLLGRARYPQVIQVAQDATVLARATQEVLHEATAAFLWGEALWRQGNFETARTQLERALALAQTECAPSQERAPTAEEVEIDSLRSLAGVRWRQGDYTGASAHLEQALGIASASGYRSRESAILGNLGVVAVEQGDYARAKTYYRLSLRIAREIGDQDSEAHNLNNLGSLCLYLGAHAEAKTYYQHALEIHREIGSRQSAPWVLGNLGLLFHYLGDDEAALEHTEDALRVGQVIGDRAMQAAMWMKLGHALLGLGRLDEAAKAYEESVDWRRELGQSNQAMEPLAGLARVALAQGNLARAQAHTEEILGHLETGTLHGTIDPFQVYVTCSHVLKANEDPRAGELLTTAYDLLQERAAKITDEAMRRSFLENVASHREIVKESAREGGEDGRR